MNDRSMKYLDDILGESKGFTTTDDFNKNSKLNETCGAINEMSLDELQKVKKQVESLIERKEHAAKEAKQNSGFTGSGF